MTQNRVFIGIDGTVMALDRASGAEIWRAELGGNFTNVVLQDGDLYATTKGELYTLDPSNGYIRWQNPLKGLGRGLVTIATAGGQQSVLMREKQDRDEAAASAASTTAAIG